jgi:hypothetical protein
MSDQLLKTLQKSGDFQAEYSPDAAAIFQMAAISECRYRWLRVPATKLASDLVRFLEAAPRGGFLTLSCVAT